MEEVTKFPEFDSYWKIYGPAQKEYMPSGPPISPLTKSFFTTWAFFDLRSGPDGETIAAKCGRSPWIWMAQWAQDVFTPPPPQGSSPHALEPLPQAASYAAAFTSTASLAAIRRWLRHTWIDRLPFHGLWEKFTEFLGPRAERQPWQRRRSLHRLEQLRQRNRQSPSQPLDVFQADVARAALDVGQVGAVEAERGSHRSIFL
jgi:hypothetical protein